MKRDNFTIPGIELPPDQPNLHHRILTPQALGFVAHLHRKYEQRRRDLMKARAERQEKLDMGKARLGKEPEGGLAHVELLLALRSRLHEIAAALLILAVQVRHEPQRLRREDAVEEVRLLGRKLDAGNAEAVAFHVCLRYFV